MMKLHHDRDLASVLIPKIINGCDEFVEATDPGQNLSDTESSADSHNPDEIVQTKIVLPYEKKDLKKKLKIIR